MQTPPGGWAFEFRKRYIYPDVDDAAEVVSSPWVGRISLTMRRKDGKTEAIRPGLFEMAPSACSAKMGAGPHLIRTTTRRYIAKIPFSDFGETLDPPSVDVAAHVVEMLAKLGYRKDFPPIRRAYKYMQR